ncbi:hypothetical protein [Ruminococcus gauvreauii]|uniref:Phage tail protein n=1 Tax=Ruminococcus gauvreauii TaxID=438033 RepID=A0ABY5VIP4_9FIRM|nr:hypothetical protein [Ruminococcus gauvreauii]UWP60435.1 phage tail protein [Ruminococcus gauvreauii]
MTINQKIIEALSDFGLPVKQDVYTGTEKEYFTFSYADTRASSFGDDKPLAITAHMQIHLFLPLGAEYQEIRNQVREKLFTAGFTYPVITELVESDTKHVIFECEIEEERED